MKVSVEMNFVGQSLSKFGNFGNFGNLQKMCQNTSYVILIEIYLPPLKNTLVDGDE